MGTRNLTAVFVNGEYKVAQYGQWDGYPEGQGKIALEFCRKFLKNPSGRKLVKKKLGLCRWVTEAEAKEAEKQAGIVDGWMNMEQAAKFHQALPYINRDHGAKVLNMIMLATDPVLLNNEMDFAADSLFCEWAYVIDLDQNTFEVYKGFNKTPPPEKSRFASMSDKRDGEYYPIRPIKIYSLNKLPTYQKFLKDCNPKEDE